MAANNEYKIPYYGITYREKYQNAKALKKWRKKHCRNSRHLFDECKSVDHYLHCDACGLMVHIAGIETSDEAVARVRNNEQPPPFIVLHRE